MIGSTMWAVFVAASIESAMKSYAEGMAYCDYLERSAAHTAEVMAILSARSESQP